MSRNIPETIRKAVAERSGNRCEYCRRLEGDSFIKFQVDHIISRKHRGQTNLENLAYACAICNGNKGSDIGTILTETNVFVRLFNPRRDDWFDHFAVAEGLIYSKSDIGEATIFVLNLNEVNRILERLDLIEAGLFP